MKTINYREFPLFTFRSSRFTLHLSLLLLSTACSPQKKLERLVAHHPELRLADTILFRDSLKLPEVTLDTALALIRLSDTTVIRKDRLEISLIRLRDTIYLKGRCKADTIIRTLRIPVERIKLIKTEPKENVLSKFMWIAAGLIVIILLLRIRN